MLHWGTAKHRVSGRALGKSDTFHKCLSSGGSNNYKTAMQLKKNTKNTPPFLSPCSDEHEPFQPRNTGKYTTIKAAPVPSAAGSHPSSLGLQEPTLSRESCFLPAGSDWVSVTCVLQTQWSMWVLVVFVLDLSKCSQL